jgi:hypothetical protein
MLGHHAVATDDLQQADAANLRFNVERVQQL